MTSVQKSPSPGETGAKLERPLREYVSLQRGTTYQSALLDQPGPVLLGLASINRNGGFRTDSLRTYGGESPAKLILKPGDLYVSLKDVTQSGDLLGAVAQVPSTVPAGRLTQDTVKLVFLGTDVSTEYIYWLLRTPGYREYCRARAIGTTNLSLSREDFLAFTVPAPSPERLALVRLLGAIEAKIDLNRHMNQTLEDMTQAVFRSWFVDFDPVRAKAEGRQPEGMDAETAALFPSRFIESAQGAIPEGWSVRMLRDITTKIGSGATPRGGSLVYANAGTAFIRSQNVFDDGFRWDGLARIDDDAAAQLSGVTVREGDILFNITGESVTRTCIVDPSALPARVSQHVAIIRPSLVSSQYLLLFLRERRTKNYLMSLDAGATRKAITKGHLETTPVLCPSKEVLTRFTQLAEPLFRRCELNDAQARALGALRDTLLPKLLSGEIRIRDADAQLAASG